MEAATPSSKKEQNVNRSKKRKLYPKKKTKPVLFPPEEDVWPELGKSVEADVIEQIKSTFTSLELQTPSKDKSMTNPKQRRKAYKAALQAWDPEHSKRRIRSKNLAIGLNVSMRCLEREQARLVLVDKDCKPALLTTHIRQLAAVRHCPVLALPHLAATVGPLLNVNSVIALAFKKVDDVSLPDPFKSLVEKTIAVTPPIETPWLSHCTKEDAETKQSEYRYTIQAQAPLDMAVYIEKNVRAAVLCEADLKDMYNPAARGSLLDTKDFISLAACATEQVGCKRPHAERYLSTNVQVTQSNTDRLATKLKSRKKTAAPAVS